MLRSAILAASLLSLSGPAHAITCDDVKARIGALFVDWNCVASTDLTTNNPATTPADNSAKKFDDPSTPLPGGAFTPVTDRTKIAPVGAHPTPIAGPVPGLQIDGYLADDPKGEARFLLRLPNDWNGDLVVAGASGTRSEFNGDFAWSDYVIQKGFAYASQNKGILNLYVLAPTDVDPLACRLNPATTIRVHFYDNDPGKPFTIWADRMIQAGRIARDGVKGAYGKQPRHTFAVGTSNGGYQVRRAVEDAPDLFDGGVDWEGTFVDGGTFNILTDLPPAILNFPGYVASGFNPASTAAQNIVAAGYPPDIVGGPGVSLWFQYWASFWEVTQCQWQKRLDPGYDTYGQGTGTYDYYARTQVSNVEQNLDAFATSGKIKAPLITVAGTMDALLPIQHQARLYADKVAASRKGNNDQRAAQYRLYEVQNGNHIESYQALWNQLELIQPHAQHAFDLLVDHVENNAALPPDQCIPRGGAISAAASPGRCANLFEP